MERASRSKQPVDLYCSPAVIIQKASADRRPSLDADLEPRDCLGRSFVWRKRTAAFNECGGSENHRFCSPNSIARSASAVAYRCRPKSRMVAPDFGISEKPSDKVDGRG